MPSNNLLILGPHMTWGWTFYFAPSNQGFFKLLHFLVQMPITNVVYSTIIYVSKVLILKLYKYANSAYNSNKSSYNVLR